MAMMMRGRPGGLGVGTGDPCRPDTSSESKRLTPEAATFWGISSRRKERQKKSPLGAVTGSPVLDGAGPRNSRGWNTDLASGGSQPAPAGLVGAMRKDRSVAAMRP